jgi:hypothetical protein
MFSHTIPLENCQAQVRLTGIFHFAETTAVSVSPSVIPPPTSPAMWTGFAAVWTMGAPATIVTDWLVTVLGEYSPFDPVTPTVRSCPT